jgi:hypothetical protein
LHVAAVHWAKPASGSAGGAGIAESLLKPEPAAHNEVPAVFQQTGFAFDLLLPQPSVLHVLKRMWFCVFFQLQPRGIKPLNAPCHSLSFGTLRPTCFTATTHSSNVKMPWPAGHPFVPAGSSS